MSPVRVLTWNLERAPRSRRDRQSAFLDKLGYDVAVLSEARTRFPHDDEHVLAPAPHGAWLEDDERKVVAWSRWGWASREAVPDGVRPTHYVAGVTLTPHGPLRMIGVTVPYSWYLVRHQPDGVEPASPWEEHEQMLAALKPAVRPDGVPQVFAGDLNQAIPRRKGVEKLAAVDALQEVLAGHEVHTEGLSDGEGKRLLCHAAATVPAVGVDVVPKLDGQGERLSDHAGAVVTLTMP